MRHLTPKTDPKETPNKGGSKYGRPDWVKALFPRLGEDVFVRSIAAMHQELDRIEGRFEKEKTPQSIKLAFQELVRARESVMRFSEIRTFMADEPEKAVEELFHRNVKVEDAAGVVSASWAVGSRGVSAPWVSGWCQRQTWVVRYGQRAETPA